GYKLANISVFRQMYRLGWEQFIPFVTTIAGVLFKDLLVGIGIGIAFSVFFILRKNYRNNFRKQEDEQGGTLTTTLTLSEEVAFLNKAGIIETLSNLPDKSRLVIDGTNSRLIDYDVLDRKSTRPNSS